MTDAPEGGNIEQRVFDCFPPDPPPGSSVKLPGACSLAFVYVVLPFYTARSIQKAVQRLIAKKLLEPVEVDRSLYRRRLGAQRPADGRTGWPKGKKQPPRRAA